MRKKLLIAVLIMAAAAVAVFLIKRHNQRQDDGALSVSGNVEITEMNVGFKAPGRIAALFAEEGRRVAAGDKLAVLDSSELENIVAQHRAGLSETKARYDDIISGSRPQDIEQAKANVSFAVAELAKAGKDYERAEMLYKNGAISASQFDAAKKTYDTANAANKAALERLSLVKEGPRKDELKAAEYRVRQAEAALRAAEERLKDTVIYAPAAGVILRKNMEIGETAGASMPVYTIGDLESPWIKVYVKEDKLGLVRLGQKAEVMTDSNPDKKYEGIVTYISSEAEFTPKNVQTQEERVKLVFGAKISVKNVNNELKPGMPADVRILLR